jgi:hypothetical protein
LRLAKEEFFWFPDSGRCGKTELGNEVLSNRAPLGC